MRGLLWVLLVCMLGLAAAVGEARPRVAVLTDGSRAHRCSMVRFLLYANSWEIAALLHSGAGDWLERQIGLYGEVHGSLVGHDPAFPAPEKLLEVVGEASVPRLVALLREPGDEPLHLLGWSGAAILEQALQAIEREHPGEREKVSKNTRVHLLGEPQASFLALAKRWPGLQILVSSAQSACLDTRWQQTVPKGYRPYLEGRWMQENILRDHGPLCASYEARSGKEAGFAAGDLFDEGASLTFLHLVPHGLGSSLHPSFGGWGGRFEKAPGGANLWREVGDAHEEKSESGRQIDVTKPVWRWLIHFQEDWSARADWCVRPYQSANHAPRPSVNGSRTGTVLGVQAIPGQKITLDAEATTDPDGHRVVKAWWYYDDASSYDGTVMIPDSVAAKIEFTVPIDGKPSRHHVILTVRDGGKPGIYAYRRVVISAAAASDETPPPTAPQLTGKLVGGQRVALSWTEVSDAESGIRRYRVYRDGATLAETNKRRYTDRSLSEGTSAAYSVTAFNGVLAEGPRSNVVMIETAADREGPGLRSVRVDSATLRLEFDEPLERASAEAAGNYRLTQGASVLSASLSDDGTTVTLVTSPLPLNTLPCLLTVRSVRDRAKSANAVGAGTSYLFLYPDSE